MLKKINTYFGKAYVRFLFFFSFLGVKICHVILHVMQMKKLCLFVIYDLWFHEFVMLKPTLNNLVVPDSILISEFVVNNYCMFFVTAVGLGVFSNLVFSRII